MNGRLRAALDYLDTGMGVIPVGSDKRPIIPWKDYQERYPSESEITEWWPDDGEANIAILTGPISGNLAVLDIDDPDLAERLASDPILREQTTMIRTPGGLHLYVVETEAQSRSGTLVPGVADLKAGGGYVVAPPSPGYRFVADGQPLRIPNARTWALRLLQEYGVETTHEPSTSRPSLAKPIRERSRNLTLASVAGTLRRRGADEATILVTLLALNSERCEPPLEEQEVERIARSYGRYPMGEEAEPREEIIPYTKGSEPYGIKFNPVPVADLLAQESAETRWLWEGYIPEGGLVLLAALPKAGKSTLAYHLGQAVASGAPFLGKPTRQAPVLILALEERRQDAVNRLRRLGVTEGVYVHPGPLKAPTAIEAITAFVREKNIGLIIVDTVRRFWNVGDENDAALVGEGLAPILALARETGAAVLLVHHLRKSPGEEGTDISGSGDIFAHVDVALTLRRRTNGQPNQRLLRSFSRYDETPDQLVIALAEGEYEAVGELDEVKAHEKRAKMQAVLSSEPRTAEELAEAAEMKEGTARPLLNALYKDGLANRTGAGVRGNPYRYTEGQVSVEEKDYSVQRDLYSTERKSKGESNGD